MKKKLLILTTALILVLGACAKPNTKEIEKSSKESIEEIKEETIKVNSEEPEKEISEKPVEEEPVEEEPVKEEKEDEVKPEDKNTSEELSEEPTKKPSEKTQKDTSKKPIKETPEKVTKKPSKEPTKETPKKTPKKKDIYTDKVITSTKSIAYKTINKETSNLAKGTTKVQTKGTNGTKELTIKIYYKNGKEIKRETISQVVTKNPVNKVVLVGTYVKPQPKPEPKPSGNSFNLSKERSVLLSKINTFRASVGSPKVAISGELNRLAQMRAEEMAKAQVYGHTRPNGLAWHTVGGSKNGYTPSGSLFLNSENIAYPNDDVAPGAGAYRDWLNSSGHNKNMKLSGTTHMGFGMADCVINGYNYRVVVMLGGQ